MQVFGEQAQRCTELYRAAANEIRAGRLDITVDAEEYAARHAALARSRNWMGQVNGRAGQDKELQRERAQASRRTDQITHELNVWESSQAEEKGRRIARGRRILERPASFSWMGEQRVSDYLDDPWADIE